MTLTQFLLVPYNPFISTGTINIYIVLVYTHNLIINLE